jgi:pRiA4b ORF-3-like protein
LRLAFRAAPSGERWRQVTLVYYGPTKRYSRNLSAPHPAPQINPPIWRRLHVGSDSSIATFHGLLQVAFDWSMGYDGYFGNPDPTVRKFADKIDGGSSVEMTGFRHMPTNIPTPVANARRRPEQILTALFSCRRDPPVNPCSNNLGHHSGRLSPMPHSAAVLWRSFRSIG